MSEQLLDHVIGPFLGPVADVSSRPWGSFQKLAENTPSSVKVITVHQGHRLSLQTHEHRHELWLLLDAPMPVEVGGRAWRADVGELVWVPARTRHRLGNDGSAPARVLEVAFGHFDEHDIVRLQDDYEGLR